MDDAIEVGPNRSGLTLSNPEYGEYLMFDDKRAYYLQARELRPRHHTIILSRVERDSVFESDFMCFETELFSTVMYGGITGAIKAVESILLSISSAAVDIDNPVALTYELGGTALSRAPVAMCGLPSAVLH